MLPRTTHGAALCNTVAGLGALTVRRTLEQATSLDVIGLRLALAAGPHLDGEPLRVVDDDGVLARSAWVTAS